MPRDISVAVGLDAGAFAAKFQTACKLLGDPEPPRLRRRLPTSHLRSSTTMAVNAAQK
jgi:hypothetical protein